jgi:hypothetical protein
MRKCPLHRNPPWGGALGHLGIIVSIAAYAIVLVEDPWENPEALGRVPEEIDGVTVAHLVSERHRWEEVVVTFRTWTTVEQALKKQIITILNLCILIFLTMAWLDFLTPLLEKCLDTSFCHMAAFPMHLVTVK